MTLDYFYGQAGELFSFFRIPKALFQEQRFQNLSTDAKTLYGILLDRMSLSAKNGWLDKQGRVFIIFTIEDVKRTLCCADNKAMKLFRELEKFGLVERKRRGLGKPKAEANDLVRRNPVRLAEKMRASGTAKRKEAFTTAEVAHLMKVLPDDRMGLSIRLLLGTGMRMQELLALEPQFIEEDGSVIHIRQAVKVVKGTVSIGSPKSKDSIRDIPVPLNVRPCAIKLRDTTDQFIWESPKTGLPCNPTHFRDVFRKSLEEAGDVRLLTPHSCRHTYVSQMQALGVDIQTIQSIVGHADTEMTEHYLHVQESIRQSAIQLFNEAFSA